MSFIEAIPSELLDKRFIGAAMEFIRVFPAPDKYRKYMTIDYAKFLGIELTKDMLDAAGIREL